MNFRFSFTHSPLLLVSTLQIDQFDLWVENALTAKVFQPNARTVYSPQARSLTSLFRLNERTWRWKSLRKE